MSVVKLQQSISESQSRGDISASFRLLHPRALLVARDGSAAAIGREFAAAIAGSDPDALAAAALRELACARCTPEAPAPRALRDGRGQPLRASIMSGALTLDFAAAVRLAPRAEAAMENTLAADLIQHFDSAAMLLDGDGFVVGASPALIRGLALACTSELQGAPFAALLGCLGEADAAEKLLSGCRSERTALWLRCADGRQRRALLRAQPLGREGHSARALFCEFEDRAPAALDALAHDLRSPLSAVLGFARLAREDLASGTTTRAAHLIARIEQSASTLDGILRSALTPMHGFENADISQVLEQIRAERKQEFERRGIRLLAPDDPPMLACRRAELYRLLSNLVGNAVDHMGDAVPPEICVSVACSGEMATLRVRDNGVGIAPELHERIFEADHSGCVHDERARHRGLGLAIVRQLAASWRGHAWVESARGDGATFLVTIPLAR